MNRLSLIIILLLNLCSLNSAREVFGFTDFVNSEIYTQYDYRKLTALVLFGDQIDKDMVLYAQSKGVRSFLNVEYPLDKLTDSNYRLNWFKKNSKKLIDFNIKGLNLQFDHPIAANDHLKIKSLTQLVKFTKENLNEIEAEFSFSVPWSPINKQDTATDGKNYDYVEIARSVDFLLVNSFHVNSQIFVNTSEYDDELCLAKSNAGFIEIAAGALKWAQLNDTDVMKRFDSKNLLDYLSNDLNDNLNDEILNMKQKIVLIYPWFGIDYTCLKRVERQRCIIQESTNIDANCSDRVATVVKYGDIIKTMNEKNLTIESDPHSRSVYLEYQNDSNVHQLWFDYHYNFAFKYAFVSQFDLGGIGFNQLNYLDYGPSEVQKIITHNMWSMVPRFRSRFN